MSGLVLKDPDGKLAYTFDWSSTVLDPITVASVAYVVPSGITKDSQVEDLPNKKTTIVLSGGTHGNDYVIEAKATVSSGEQVPASLVVRVFSA
jgi:hypothetical protein